MTTFPQPLATVFSMPGPLPPATPVPCTRPPALTCPSGVTCVLQATQAALATEEPRVAQLQAQLKELIVSPHDPQLLPNSVVTAIQEYLRYLWGRGGRGSGASSAFQGHLRAEGSLPLAAW